MAQKLPPKKDVALALLESSTVFMHLDPRVEDVKVPPWFKRQPQLVLQIGLNMPVPIPDLNVDDASVSCTLSFNRSPFFCYVPWKAVYALVGEDGRGRVWPEDIPPEVAAQAQAQARASQPQVQAAPQPQPQRSHLRAVPASAPEQPRSVKERPAKTPAQRAVSSRSAGAKTGSAAEKKKRTRKKPEGGRAQPRRRPALAAVDKQQERRSAAESGSDATTKKKRELPPYLRIVK
jgi:stringent starvation protein B